MTSPLSRKRWICILCTFCELMGKCSLARIVLGEEVWASHLLSSIDNAVLIKYDDAECTGVKNCSTVDPTELKR